MGTMGAGQVLVKLGGGPGDTFAAWLVTQGQGRPTGAWNSKHTKFLLELSLSRMEVPSVLAQHTAL